MCRNIRQLNLEDPRVLYKLPVRVFPQVAGIELRVERESHPDKRLISSYAQIRWNCYRNQEQSRRKRRRQSSGKPG